MKASESAIDRLETNLGRLLNAGVMTAAVCLGIGLLLSMAGAGAPAHAVLSAGLVILMATPMTRVVVSLVAFIRMRDWFFVATTALVFALLAVTVVVAWLTHL